MSLHRVLPVSFVFILCVLLVVFAPVSVAQVAGPLERCSRDCTPDEVNRGIVRTGDEPVKLVLFGHFEDILNMAPLNVQAPDRVREPDVNRGFLMPVINTNTGLCLAATCADFHFKNNEFVMYSSPGLVEYLEEGWRTNQHPGLGADVPILADQIHLFWYMSADSIPVESSPVHPGPIAKVGVMPQVGVYARLETGRFRFQGELIAESAKPGFGAERVNMVSLPGMPDVYEFRVAMKVLQPRIPASPSSNGFIVYVNPYQVGSGDTQVGQADWRVRSGADFPPRLVFETSSPLKTVGTSLSIYESRLWASWAVMPALGSYDMREPDLLFRSTGQMPIDRAAIDFIILRRSIDCDGAFKPANMTWAIDYTLSPLADGEYELTASIPNLQKTYLLEERFPFTVKDGVPQVREIPSNKPRFEGTSSVPGFEAPGLLLALLGGLGLGLRRRCAGS